MGVKMGQPAFEIRDLIYSGKIVAYSGNHRLYREKSLKVHDIFRRFVPFTIDYSVDESFLDMSGIPDAMITEIGNAICEACWKEERIPVTLGFASTKTLAKIAAETGKNTPIFFDSLLRATTQPSLFDSTTIATPSSEGSIDRSHDTKKLLQSANPIIIYLRYR